MRSVVLLFLMFLCLSCSFEYGDLIVDTEVFPDITMENLEYTRMRNGKLSATLTAEVSERYETTHIMSLNKYTFKQYETVNETLDAEGSGGDASIELVQNNIRMTQGVSIRIDSEDFAVETMALEWQDKNKVLRGGENVPVNLSRSDGTELTGSDFHANIRDRTWVFGSNVHGIYVDDDDNKKNSNDKDNKRKDNGNKDKTNTEVKEPAEEDLQNDVQAGLPAE